MAETPGIISNTIIVNATQAKQEFETLSRQLREIKTAHEKALSSKSNTTLFKGEQQSAEALQRQIVLLTDSLYKLRNLQNVGISSTNERVNVAANKKYYEDQLRASKELSAALKEQMKTDVAYGKYLNGLGTRYNRQDAKTDARESQIWAQYARSSQSAKPQDYQGYARQIQVARAEAERLHQVMLRNNTEQTRLDFANAKTGLQASVKASEEFNRSIGIGAEKVGYLGSLTQKLRSHFNWILAGSLLAAFAVIPTAVEDITRETEVLGQKLKQNLELAERYRDNHQGLDADIKHLSDVAATFAVGYGANVKDVMEMMQVLSRRFKSPEELTYYTNLAMIMHKLDFVAPKKAAEDLEAVILSMGLDFHGASRFIDEFSVAVHTARITGTDLLSGLQRSGATMHNMNLNTAESIALISTLSTVTAKAGGNIGNSLNSILINIDFKKAAAALKAYSVQVYDSSGEMRRGVEIWREVAQVFNGLDDEKANEFANAMSGGKFRANDLRALLGNWHEFEEILKNINEKASPELTASLLKTGMETYDTSIKKLNASLQVFGVIIGNEVLPGLKSMVDGLSEGIQWLNDHRKEVGEVITGLKYFVEALILYRAQQALANATLRTFTGQLATTMLMRGEFITVMGAMGASVRGFAATVATATMNMMGLWAIFSAMKETFDATSQAKGEKEYLSKLPKGDLQSIKEVDEVQMLIGERDRLADLPGNFNVKKVSELNQQIRDKLAEKKANSSMDKVKQMVAEAEKGMPASKEIPDYAKVTGEEIYPSANKNAVKAEPSDYAEQMQRIANQAEYRNIVNSIDIAEKNHTNTLGKLATQEAIYGKTIGLTLENQKANRDFIVTLGAEYDSLETLKQGYIEQLEGELSTNSELNETLSLAIPNWTSLTKAQQREQAKLNSELFQSFKTADALNKLIGEIEGKQVGLHNSADNLRNEETKTNLGGTGDVIKQSNRRISGIKDQESIDIANATNKVDANNDIELNRIKLKALYDQQFEHNAQIEFLISEVDKARVRGLPAVLEAKQDELRKERVLYAQNAAAIKELEYEKNSKIKEGLYGITQEVLIQGNSLKSVWNNLWTTLANDALKALFKVQNGSGGLLNSVLGILGGSSSSGSSGGAIGGYSQKVIGSLSGKTYFADGGLVSKPTNAVIGETGDTEAVINLGKLQKGDSRQRGLLSYANSKLGTQVEASVSQRTIDIAQQTSIIGKQTQIQSQHITELQRANELMMQQNNMILHMINNGSGGQAAIAQPIVMSQSMSDSEFYAKIQKLKAQGYPMG